MSIKNFLKRLFRKRKYRKVIIVDSNADAIPQNDAVTIVRKNGAFTWVKFKCPCGCGRDVVLSLNPLIKPYWSITVQTYNGKNRVTLSPSVNLTGYKCKSHFFVRNNNIEWV